VSPSARLRVLVAEDSVTVRRRIVEVLRAEPDIDVVGEAADGGQAIELCARLNPDVMTLDMVMPVMSGLAATEHIMAWCPTPIVVVSSSFNRGEMFHAYDALAAGAIEVLEKPSGRAVLDDAWERTLISTVRLASRINVVSHPRARLRAAGRPRVAGAGGTPAHLVAIGASTGGPAALVRILSALDRRFPLPILVVLHIGRPFGEGLADWLSGHTGLPVSQVKDGEPLPAPGEGRVLIAPPEAHLEVARGLLRLTSAPERHSCRPSIDVLFESIARTPCDGVVACLLTGMGRDGAAGLLALRRAGALTIAQDEASSVVYGMPKEAAEIGAAARVLALDGIVSLLASLATPAGLHRSSSPARA